MQDSKYTGWQRGTVVMMLGDNGAEVAIFQGVGGIGRGIGWQLYGVLTVQDENEEEGYLWYRVVKCVMQWCQAGPGLRGRLEGSCIRWRWCRAVRVLDDNIVIGSAG